MPAITVEWDYSGPEPSGLARKIRAAWDDVFSKPQSGGSSSALSTARQELQQLTQEAEAAGTARTVSEARTQQKLTTIEQQGHAARQQANARHEQQLETIAKRGANSREAADIRLQRQRTTNAAKEAAELQQIEARLQANLEALARRGQTREDSFGARVRRNASAIRESGEALQNAGFAATVFGEQIVQVGKAAFDSAVSIDRQINVLKVFTGSAEAAERRYAKLVETASRTPGLTTNLAATLDAQLRVANVNERTIDRVLGIVGKINAVTPLGDPAKFASNLIQLITQGFERTDLKELVGQSPLAGDLIKTLFNVDSPTNAKAIREQAKKMGIKTADEFLTQFAEKSASNPKLALVTESLGTQFDKLSGRIQVALRPLGQAIIETIAPALEKLVPAIEGTAQSFQQLPASARELIVVAGALTVALGPFLIGLGAIVQSGAAVVTLFGALGGGAAIAASTVGVLGISLGTVAAIVAGSVIVFTALAVLYDRLANGSQTLTGATLAEVETAVASAKAREEQAKKTEDLISKNNLTAQTMTELNKQYEQLSPAQQSRVRLLEQESKSTDLARSRAEALLVVQRELATLDKDKAKTRALDIAQDFLILAEKSRTAQAELAKMQTRLDALTVAVAGGKTQLEVSLGSYDEYGRAASTASDELKILSSEVEKQIKLEQAARKAANEKADVLKLAAAAAGVTTGALVNQLDTLDRLPVGFQQAGKAVRDFGADQERLGPLLKAASKEARAQAEQIGVSIVQGSIVGIQKEQANYWAAVKNYLTVGTQVAKDTVQSKSPSLVFAKIGSDIGAGLVLGIQSRKSDVNKASKELAQEAVKSAREEQAALIALVTATPATKQRLADAETAREVKSELQEILSLRRELGEAINAPLPKTQRGRDDELARLERQRDVGEEIRRLTYAQAEAEAELTVQRARLVAVPITNTLLAEAKLVDEDIERSNALTEALAEQTAQRQRLLEVLASEGRTRRTARIDVENETGNRATKALETRFQLEERLNFLQSERGQQALREATAEEAKSDRLREELSLVQRIAALKARIAEGQPSHALVNQETSAQSDFQRDQFISNTTADIETTARRLKELQAGQVKEVQVVQLQAQQAIVSNAFKTAQTLADLRAKDREDYVNSEAFKLQAAAASEVAQRQQALKTSEALAALRKEDEEGYTNSERFKRAAANESALAFKQSARATKEALAAFYAEDERNFTESEEFKQAQFDKFQLQKRQQQRQLIEQNEQLKLELNSGGLVSNAEAENAQLQALVRIQQADKEAYLSMIGSRVALADATVFHADRARAKVLEYLQQQTKSITDIASDAQVGIIKLAFDGIDSAVGRLTAKFGVFKGIIADIISSFAKLVLSRGFQALFGLGNAPQSGGGGGGGFFSFLNNGAGGQSGLSLLGLGGGNNGTGGLSALGNFGLTVPSLAGPSSGFNVGNFGLTIPNLNQFAGVPGSGSLAGGQGGQLTGLSGILSKIFPGAGGALLPLLGAGIGAQFGGQSTAGKILGAIGGGAVGLGVSFGASVFGALGGGLGALGPAALAALGPIALIGIPLIIGAILLGRAKQRAKDEEQSGVYLQTAIDAIKELERQALQGNLIDEQQARSIFQDQILATFKSQISTLKTGSVVRSRLQNQTADLTRLFETSVIPAIRKAKEYNSVFKQQKPEFHEGGLAQNETVAVLLKDEVVLTRNQQRELVRQVGFNIFGALGVPGTMGLHAALGLPTAHNGFVYRDRRFFTPEDQASAAPILRPAPGVSGFSTGAEAPTGGGGSAGGGVTLNFKGMKLQLSIGQFTEILGAVLETADGKEVLVGAIDDAIESNRLIT